MDGRQVFIRPEGRASTAAKRDIITSESEREAMAKAHVASALARRAMTNEQIEDEIEEFDELDKKKMQAERERSPDE